LKIVFRDKPVSLPISAAVRQICQRWVRLASRNMDRQTTTAAYCFN
jgi:hypothetical protein